MITPNSAFDRYIKGDENAISARAKKGFEAFKSNGCIFSHQEQNIGGNMYQKIGIFEEYPNQENLELYELTKKRRGQTSF